MMKSGKNMFRALRIFFGLFMVLVYVGMAVLMFINFFDWSSSLTWFRYILAVVFMAYGVYRCYRQIAGIDYYRLKDMEDTDSDDKK